MQHGWWLLVPVLVVAVVSCGDDGGDDPGGTAGSSGGGGSGGTSADPCARPVVVCACDERATNDVCYEFHPPAFTEAACAPAICPEGELIEPSCPAEARVGYCVGATTDRSETYYADAATAEMECLDGGGTWCQ